MTSVWHSSHAHGSSGSRSGLRVDQPSTTSAVQQRETAMRRPTKSQAELLAKPLCENERSARDSPRVCASSTWPMSMPRSPAWGVDHRHQHGGEDQKHLHGFTNPQPDDRQRISAKVGTARLICTRPSIQAPRPCGSALRPAQRTTPASTPSNSPVGKPARRMPTGGATTNHRPPSHSLPPPPMRGAVSVSGAHPHLDASSPQHQQQHRPPPASWMQAAAAGASAGKRDGTIRHFVDASAHCALRAMHALPYRQWSEARQRWWCGLMLYSSGDPRGVRQQVSGWP